MSKPSPASLYDAEVRFGVVMYGGVSLAIYIYGVSRELFELACATPRDGTPLRLADGEGTRAIYGRLARLASDPQLLADYAAALRERDGPGAGAARDEVSGPPPVSPPADVWQGDWDAGERTRFVIDVISGTSAGGINGIYLAKALALAQPFSVLNDLWVNEGDLGRLLNDGQASDGLVGGLPEQDGAPKSLLSSDRMYRKLLQALDDMQREAGEAAESPLLDELDLFVTTTDIAGSPVPLRLHDKVVLERRHKQRFHFSYPSHLPEGEQRPGHDFAAVNHPFLAYAARCTSSFPFAFEPMQLSRVPLLNPATSKAALEDWKPYFDAYAPKVLARDDWSARPFGDGGYLDNKPFGYVVEALSRRFGDAPAQRKLLYIEPDPERLDEVHSADAPVPDALGNALDALSAIPLYETIREDLLALLQRNRRIDRVERLLRLAELEIEGEGDHRSEPPPEPFDRVNCEPGVEGQPGAVPAWSSLPLSSMVAYYGQGFLPYRRLRVYAVTDWLAAQIAQAFGLDAESDLGYALRAVVRAWREDRYADEPDGASGKLSVNTFLDRYDLDYRLRRSGFLLRRIDQITRLLLAQRRATPPAASELEALIIRKMDRRTIGTPEQLRHSGRLEATIDAIREIRRALHATHRQLADAFRRRAQGDAVPEDLREDPALREELLQVLARLISDSASVAAPRLRSVQPGVMLAMPALPPMLDTHATTHNLQDRVMARVKAWLADAVRDGQPTLVLWRALCDTLDALALKPAATPGVPAPAAATAASSPAAALPACPVEPGQATADDPAMARLLKAQWQVLGEPHLVAEKRAVPKPFNGVLRQWRARLQVLPVQGQSHLLRALDEPVLQTQADALRELLGEYYLSFDEYDQTRFTLYYETDTGEPTVVDVLRVSPDDATSLRPDGQRRTLAGVSMAHFGAFLDEQWRRNDILWGRLDGAERLLQAVLPGQGEDTVRVRDELLRLAQGAILRNTLQSRSAGALTQRLLAGLQQPLSAIDNDTADTRWQRQDRRDRLYNLMQGLAQPGSATQQALVQQLASGLVPDVLHALLDPSGLRHCVAHLPTFDPRPASGPLLRHAARAVTITGRVLDGLSQDARVASKPVGRWMVRMGQVLQAATALALPGVGMPVARRLMLSLYSVEIVLLLGALLLGDSGLRTVALALLGTSATVHLVVLALTDALRRGRVGGPRWAALTALLLGGVLALAAAGGLALVNHGLGVLRPSPAAATTPSAPAAGKTAGAGSWRLEAIRARTGSVPGGAGGRALVVAQPPLSALAQPQRRAQGVVGQ